MIHLASDLRFHLHSGDALVRSRFPTLMRCCSPIVLQACKAPPHVAVVGCHEMA